MIKPELFLDTRPEPNRCAGYWLPTRGSALSPGGEGWQVEVDLTRVWAELTHGRCRIVETFVTAQRCYVVVEPQARDRTRPAELAPSRIKTLESILLGEGRKAIALRQGVNVRTVTANATCALQAMGCCCLLSRLPMALFTLAHAANDLTDLRKGRMGPLERGACRYRIVGVERVDDCVVHMLSPAEAAVTRLFLAGESHDAIARRRKAARHTIANQLTATFQKLGVSGRIDLLRMLHADPQARNLRALNAARRAQPITTSMFVGQGSSEEATAAVGSQLS